MRKTLLLLWFSLLFQSAYAADSTYVLDTTFETKATKLYSDHLGNFYLVSDNKLSKHNKEGRFIKDYQAIGLGPISHVDVTNPLRIIVFFEFYQQIITLDNTLSKTGEYDLAIEGLADVSTVGAATDNSIWIYDRIDGRLKKIDQHSNITHYSDDLRQRFKDFDPHLVIQSENLVYLIDKEYGTIILDNFGSYKKWVKITPPAKAQVIKKQIVYLDKKMLKVINTETMEISHYPVAVTDGLVAVEIQKDRLYTLVENRLLLHRF